MDDFTRQYIETALWSSMDGDDDEPMDENYALGDIAPEALAKMTADCAAFQAKHYDLISDDPSLAGHDFWLTRNGHGAGFWDGDWPEAIGEALTKASKAYGECDLYVGDDGQVYI